MRRFGHGTLDIEDVGRYEGQIIYGVFHGHGVCEWVDGGRYEGEWKDGKRHGHGVYESEDGTRCEGHWDDGKPHGRFFEWGTDGTSMTTLLEVGQVISTEPIPFLSMDEMRLGVLWAKGEMERTWR